MENKKTDYNTCHANIPAEWEVKTVGEAFQICNQLRYPINEEERRKMSGIYPYYGPTKIQDYINEYRIEGKYALIGEDGDHFLKWKELPMTLLVEGKFNVNNHAHVIKGIINTTEWFYYYFNHRELTPYLTRQGAGRYKLTKEALRKIPCLLPPPSEQRAIAACLSTWDSAIQKTTQLIAQKERRKKWLMQQLLTGKKRLKGFEGAWREVRMNDVFREIKASNDGEIGHVVMTISSKLGLISQEDKFDRVIAGDSLKKYTLLKRFDFAYNKGNSKTYQMGCVYQLEEQESALVPFVYICFSPTKKAHAAFYKHWFYGHGLDRQLKKIISSGARGDGLLNVNSDDFFNLKIPLPSLAEQTAIAHILKTADQELQLLKAKVEMMKEQKKGMMQVLLTGKVRLNPLSLIFKQDVI